MQTAAKLVICVGERVSEQSAEVMRRLGRDNGWRFVMSDWLHAGDLAEAAAVWLVDTCEANLTQLPRIPQNVPVLCPEDHPELDLFVAEHRVIRFRGGLEAEAALQDLAKSPLLPGRAVAAGA